MKDCFILLFVWLSHIVIVTNTEDINLMLFNKTDVWQSFTSEVSPSVTGSTTQPEIAAEASCRQKCGQIQQLPCSCDMKCLVHKNCCEDMSIVCPEVLQESRKKYSHMLNMKVECAKEENIFVITACGDSSQTSEMHNDGSLHTRFPITLSSSTIVTKDKATSLSISTIVSKSQTQQQHQSYINNLLDVINNPYVTDTTTGFVYKNMDIFACGAREKSNPVKWVTRSISYNADKFSVPSTIQGLINVMYNTKYSLIYSPPTELTKNQLGAYCVRSKGTCETHTDISLLNKCQQFISYVKGVDTYNNKYCAMCNSDKRFTIEKQAVTNFVFKPQMSITLSGQSLKITSHMQETWLEIMCQLIESNTSGQISMEGRCWTEKCDNAVPAFKRPDGYCKYLNYMTIAVSDDPYPLSVEVQRMFPEFVRCFFKSYIGLDIDDDLIPTETLFDLRLNQILYVTKIYIYSDSTNDIVAKSELKKHEVYRLLSLMSKTLKAYLRSKVNMSEVLHLRNKTYNKQEIYSLDFLALLKEVDIHNHDRKSKITNKTDLTTTCMCSVLNVYSTKRSPVYCLLVCFQDPMYEGDDAAITDYLNSTCFSVFKNKINDGHKISFSRNVFTFILFVNLFLKRFKVQQ